jgi:hypothetical protein
MNKRYSEKAFWDERYDSKTAKPSSDSAAPVNSTNDAATAASEEVDVYEWYVPFESIKDRLLADLGTSPKQLGRTILLPGCGNSCLGEDLAMNGIACLLIMITSENGIEAHSLGLSRLLSSAGCGLRYKRDRNHEAKCGVKEYHWSQICCGTL